MALNTLTWQRCLANLAPSGTIEITENGEYDVAQYATAEVNVSGGGSSDYSTATVTFTNNSNIAFALSIPYLYDGEIDAYISSGDMDGGDFEVILYKGQSLGYISFLPTQDSSNIPAIETTGDIVANVAMLTISGDGTVTFNNPLS